MKKLIGVIAAFVILVGLVLASNMSVTDISTLDFNAYRHRGTGHGTAYYIGGRQAVSAAYTTVAPTTGKVYAMPYYAATGGTVDSISMRLTTNGGTGTLATAAIYDSSSYSNIAPTTPVAGSNVTFGLVDSGAARTITQAGNLADTFGASVDTTHATLATGATWVDGYRGFKVVFTETSTGATQTSRITASTLATPTVITFTPATSAAVDPNYTYAITFGVDLLGGHLYWLLYADTSSNLAVAAPTYTGVTATNVPPLIDSGAIASAAPGCIISRGWAPATAVLENPFADTVTAEFVCINFPAIFIHFAS